jgi:hypothetical protein
MDKDQQERPLDSFERWMVKRNIYHAGVEGVDLVVARLEAGGYDRIAEAVREYFDAETQEDQT